MRLLFLLPKVEPDNFPQPQVCPRPGCQGKHFRLFQEVRKPLRDTHYSEVKVHRYRCLRCGHTFRVYPAGVSGAHFSQRVKGLAVVLYLLGLSYGAVSLLLEALGVAMSKTLVYLTVQKAGDRVPGMRREQVFEGIRTPALGSDVTAVKVKGKWYPIGLTTDGVSGLVLTVDELEGEEAETLKEWLRPVAEAVGAEILVTDDADAFKEVADELEDGASGLQELRVAEHRMTGGGIEGVGKERRRRLVASAGGAPGAGDGGFRPVETTGSATATGRWDGIGADVEVSGSEDAG